MKRFYCYVNATALLFSVAFFAMSCGKDGKTGPQGETGATGPAGPTGPKGDAGTANVIYSDWLNVAFLPDTIHTSGGGIDTVGFYADVDVPKLDATMLSTGEMKVYVNAYTAGDPTVYPLPYLNAYSGFSISVSFFTGGIELYANADASTYQDNSGTVYQQYRYVLVPGSTEARKAKTVDLSDYKAVKAWLNLK